MHSREKKWPAEPFWSLGPPTPDEPYRLNRLKAALFLLRLLLALVLAILAALFLHRSGSVLIAIAVGRHFATTTTARCFSTATAALMATAAALATTAAFATAAAHPRTTAASTRGVREQMVEATTERTTMAAAAATTIIA